MINLRNKNQFTELYLRIPRKEEIRKFILTIAFYCGFVTYAMFIICYQELNDQIPKNIMNLANIVVLIYGLITLIFIIKAKVIGRFYFLYMGISLTGSSILNLIIAAKFLFESYYMSFAMLIIVTTIIIYIALTLAFFIHIKNKIKRNIINVPLNKGIYTSIAAGGSVVGVLLAKKSIGDFNPFVIMVLLSSSLIIFGVNFFYKFYLIGKK